MAAGRALILLRRVVPVLAGGVVLLGVFLPGSTVIRVGGRAGSAPGPLAAGSAAGGPAPGAPVPGLPGGLPGISLPAGLGGLPNLTLPGLGGGGCTAVPGFDSPYLGHTGNTDGAGGDAGGAAKTSDMGLEQSVGMHWTFMPVYWAKFEPSGPTDAANDPAGAWKELDGAVALAHQDGLYPFIQIAVGGNAGNPPSWAGQRTSGKSAPVNMDALINFVGKLASRYKPGGPLAQSKGWGSCFGVSAWELDNEPNSYETDWSSEAGDYAEFVEKSYKRIHSIDPHAIVMDPAVSEGGADRSSNNPTWLDSVLAAGHNGNYSSQYPQDGGPYAAGPYSDVVSFHAYEFLDCVFVRFDCTITTAHHQVAAVYNDPKYLNQAGFSYAPKTQYWCTECEYDFGTPDEVGYRADWVVQWMARAFADGVTRLTLMDLNNSASETVAAKTWISIFHNNPYSLTDVTAALGDDPTQVRVFRWTSPLNGHWIYVAWAANGGQSSYTVQLPVRTAEPFQIDISGNVTLLHAAGGKVGITLAQGAPFSAPTFITDGLPGAP